MMSYQEEGLLRRGLGNEGQCKLSDVEEGDERGDGDGYEAENDDNDDGEESVYDDMGMYKD
ncbi:hypothetical protein OROMI_020571 [Orobanche minor]